MILKFKSRKFYIVTNADDVIIKNRYKITISK